MFWVVMILLLISSIIDSLVEGYKRKDPSFQQSQVLKAEEKAKENRELRKRLQEEIGNTCLLSFSNLSLISEYSDKCRGKITHVEDHWLAVETGKNQKRKQIIFKIEDIRTVSKII